MVEDDVAAAGAADTAIGILDENPSEESGSGNGSNTGAIVGGVLGGFAILGLLTAAFFYMVLRHRRQVKRDELAARDAAVAADATDGPDSPGVPNATDDFCTTDMTATSRKSDDVVADDVGAAEMEEPKEPKIELPIRTSSQEELREGIGNTQEPRHPAMKDGEEVYEAP